jgi:hypothetical protein
MGGAVILALTWALSTSAQTPGDSGDDAKAQLGLRISPVELSLEGKNRSLVGLGSYIVNAQGICGDCHTSPMFAPGGNPFLGEPEVINAARFLAGGRRFAGGTIISRNLTPDVESGLPADLTYAEFALVMRTGFDLGQVPPHIPSDDEDLLQIMPWPWFNKMSDRDLRAVYEYLRAIPSVP